MKYRLIASDIDGTLTDQWREVNPRNQAVIQQLVKKNVAFMVATGRSFKSAEPILKSLDVQCYACLINGAVLISYPDLKVIHTHYLTVEEKNLILEKVNLAGGNAVMYNGFEGGDKIYYTSDYNTNQVLKAVVEATFDRSIQVDDLIQDVNHDVPVISCVGTEEQIDQIMKELEPMDDRFNILKLRENYYENFFWLMITKRGADKVHGIQYIADYLGVEQEEIIAIGDDMNDLEMVKYAGLGIAMENGVTPLKEVADRIAPRCEKDGMAQIFTEIFDL